MTDKVPYGVILMWNGTAATIPTGWQVCDGTNGTPDLRGKFIYGANGDTSVGLTGGADSHVHTNPDTEYADASHSHKISGTTSAATGGAAGTSGTSTTVASATHTHPFSTTSNAATSSHKHSVPDTASGTSLPPYTKVYYIMKVT